MTNCFCFVCLKIISYPHFFPNRSICFSATACRSQLGWSTSSPDREVVRQHLELVPRARQEVGRNLQSLSAGQRGRRVGQLDQDKGATRSNPGITIYGFENLPKSSIRDETCSKTLGLLIKRTFYLSRMSVTTSSRSR